MGLDSLVGRTLRRRLSKKSFVGFQMAFVASLTAALKQRS